MRHSVESGGVGGVPETKHDTSRAGAHLEDSMEPVEPLRRKCEREPDEARHHEHTCNRTDAEHDEIREPEYRRVDLRKDEEREGGRSRESVDTAHDEWLETDASAAGPVRHLVRMSSRRRVVKVDVRMLGVCVV